MSKRWRLLWRAFSWCFLIAIFSVGIALVLASGAARSYAIEREGHALLELAERWSPTLAESGGDRRALAREVSQRLGRRVSLFDSDGRLVADSIDSPPRSTDIEVDRPEVAAAIAGNPTWVERHSVDHLEPYVFAAVPMRVDGTIVGVARTGRSVADVESSLRAYRHRMRVSGAFIALFAALASLLFARGLAKPIEIMRRGIERLGRGDLNRPIPSSTVLELDELADAMNRMAAQLDDRISQVTRQRNERDAILASMQEGVLAIDDHDRILSINRAGELLLGVQASLVTGRLVQEALRHSELQRFIAEARKPNATHDDEDDTEANTITLHGGTAMFLQVRSAPLLDATSNRIGILIILADVTHIRRLENLRREFVANVSHELRTPITSIQGFAETLIDGALDDPAEARRFIEIIARQSERLSGIIEDLLSLTRLDRTERIERETVRVAGLLRAAVEACGRSIDEKRTRVVLDCPDGLTANLQPTLFAQAIINLVDNAVKYGGENGEVTLRAEATDGRLRIEVADRGPGIAPEHLPRLFERFYRVDKARSREIGGTGLGLSIVKHVAKLHGGEVTVQSTLGQGTTFFLAVSPE